MNLIDENPYPEAQAHAGTLSFSTLDRMVQVLKDLPPEPFGEWMRERGCPPEDCWLLVLPLRWQPLGPAVWPDYVRFWVDTLKPMLIKSTAP